MKIHEKIKQIRLEKRLSREELYERLRAIFGEKAVTPNTICVLKAELLRHGPPLCTSSVSASG